MRLLKTIFTAALLLSGSAHAIGLLNTNLYITSTQEQFVDEQAILTDTGEAAATYANDLFVHANGAFKLNGVYQGNTWISSAQTVELEGHCSRNLRVAASSVKIDGQIDGNLIAFGQTIQITTNAILNGSIRLFGNTIVQEGTIKGDATIYSATLLTLGGTLQSNANIVATDLIFNREAHIAGNLTYLCSKELLPDEGVVGGKLERRIPKPEPIFLADRIGQQLLWCLAALLVGVLFITLFPLTTAMASQLARTSSLKCLLVGLLFTTVLPFFGVAALGSGLGLPLGLLLLGSSAALIYLSRIIIGIMIGTLLLRPKKPSIGLILAAMAVGVSLIYVTTLFPMISTPVQLAVAWTGVGAQILALLRKRRLVVQLPQNLNPLKELNVEQEQSKEESP